MEDQTRVNSDESYEWKDNDDDEDDGPTHMEIAAGNKPTIPNTALYSDVANDTNLLDENVNIELIYNTNTAQDEVVVAALNTINLKDVNKSTTALKDASPKTTFQMNDSTQNIERDGDALQNTIAHEEIPKVTSVNLQEGDKYVAQSTIVYKGVDKNRAKEIKQKVESDIDHKKITHMIVDKDATPNNTAQEERIQVQDAAHNTLTLKKEDKHEATNWRAYDKSLVIEVGATRKVTFRKGNNVPLQNTNSDTTTQERISHTAVTHEKVDIGETQNTTAYLGDGDAIINLFNTIIHKKKNSQEDQFVTQNTIAHQNNHIERDEDASVNTIVCKGVDKNKTSQKLQELERKTNQDKMPQLEVDNTAAEDRIQDAAQVTLTHNKVDKGGEKMRRDKNLAYDKTMQIEVSGAQKEDKDTSQNKVEDGDAIIQLFNTIIFKEIDKDLSQITTTQEDDCVTQNTITNEKVHEATAVQKRELDAAPNTIMYKVDKDEANRKCQKVEKETTNVKTTQVEVDKYKSKNTTVQKGAGDAVQDTIILKKKVKDSSQNTTAQEKDDCVKQKIITYEKGQKRGEDVAPNGVGQKQQEIERETKQEKSVEVDKYAICNNSSQEEEIQDTGQITFTDKRLYKAGAWKWRDKNSAYNKSLRITASPKWKVNVQKRVMDASQNTLTYTAALEENKVVAQKNTYEKVEIDPQNSTAQEDRDASQNTIIHEEITKVTTAHEGDEDAPPNIMLYKGVDKDEASRKLQKVERESNQSKSTQMEIEEDTTREATARVQDATLFTYSHKKVNKDEAKKRRDTDLAYDKSMQNKVGATRKLTVQKEGKDASQDTISHMIEDKEVSRKRRSTDEVDDKTRKKSEKDATQNTITLEDKNALQKTIIHKEIEGDEVQNTTQKVEDKLTCAATKKITPNALIIEDAAISLSHDELLEVTKSSLCTLTSCDSLLSDLPEDVILEEVLSHIAVEHGQSITIFISREDKPQLRVIIPQGCTVRELKKAVNRHFEMYQKRKRNKVKISWKYIWRTYDLIFDGIVLDNDSNSIDTYNITNKVTLGFKKKHRKKDAKRKLATATNSCNK